MIEFSLPFLNKAGGIGGDWEETICWPFLFKWSRAQTTYVSPSDDIVSPCTKKLSDLKGKRFKKYVDAVCTLFCAWDLSFSVFMTWLNFANFIACPSSAGKPPSLFAKLGKKSFEQSSASASPTEQAWRQGTWVDLTCPLLSFFETGEVRPLSCLILSLQAAPPSFISPLFFFPSYGLLSSGWMVMKYLSRAVLCYAMPCCAMPMLRVIGLGLCCSFFGSCMDFGG